MAKIISLAVALMSIALTSAAYAVPVAAPEIDATSGLAAMSVLVGVLAWVSERRRAR